MDFLWNVCGGSGGTDCPSNVGLWRQGPTLDLSGPLVSLRPTCLLVGSSEISLRRLHDHQLRLLCNQLIEPYPRSRACLPRARRRQGGRREYFLRIQAQEPIGLGRGLAGAAFSTISALIHLDRMKNPLLGHHWRVRCRSPSYAVLPLPCLHETFAQNLPSPDILRPRLGTFRHTLHWLPGQMPPPSGVPAARLLSVANRLQVAFGGDSPTQSLPGTKHAFPSRGTSLSGH